MEKGRRNEEYGAGGGGVSCSPFWSLSFKVKLLHEQSGAQPHQHKLGNAMVRQQGGSGV